MPVSSARVRVHIVCKDVTEGPQTMRPEEIEVCTVDGRLVNDMGPRDFPRSIIEDIEAAILQAGFRAGVIGARVSVERTTDRGKGITVVRAKLRYSNGRIA